MIHNLYVHFPFCRSRCSYCTLYSRAGSSAEDRESYVKNLVDKVHGKYKTVYFGGGSPALCNLKPLLNNLKAEEFTVELHPLDATREKLEELKNGGVNRISMGIQSLDDDILRHMCRGYTFTEAERAFYLVREYFDNAGIDLIVGYPGETAALTPRHARLAKWGLKHCSVYSLQNERGLKDVIDDETVMNRISVTAKFLKDLGLERYEISNYAVPGYECRHNLAVWRGEDYLGIGDGACGREGLKRTKSGKTETVSEDTDRKERALFRLRTREGIDSSLFPEWRDTLERFSSQGLVIKADGPVYRLTERGTEVCDTILAELV